MCCFGSIWCHGDRVECRVTGWGETACPGHTDPETGGHTYGILFQHVQRRKGNVPQKCVSMSRLSWELS